MHASDSANWEYKINKITKSRLRTFGSLTVAYTQYALARRAYCWRVKTVVKASGSSLHGPVCVQRDEGGRGVF